MPTSDIKKGPLYVDSTNNRVGIGTASPSSSLHIDGTTPSIFIQPSADTEVAAIRFRNAADSNTLGMIEYNHSEHSMSFRTNGVSDRVFIDSSGNVLVGKTANDINTTGTNITNYGLVAASRSGGYALALNRSTSDGEIVSFRKDGSTVGSIGNVGSYLQIDTSLYSGLFLGASAVFPKNNGSLSDNVTSLGGSSYRWKDLYLSGGIQFDSRSNKLDDYEEGTWTPTYEGSISNPTVTHDVQEGLYTKVGNLVTIAFKIGTDAATGGSGNLLVAGVPFSPVTTAYFGVVSYSFTGSNATYNSVRPIYGFLTGNTIRVWQANTTNIQCSALSNSGNANRLFAVFHYYTNA